MVSSHLRVWTYTVVDSPDLSTEVHHFQWGRELQEGDAPWLALTTTWRQQPASHGKYNFHLLLITQVWDPPSCNLQYLCPALYLSATIQPSVSQRHSVGSCDAKILCILIMLAFFFFNIMGLSCPHKPSSLDGWGLADTKFGRKLCIPVSAMLHHIPACPSHCSSTSNHIGFWWVTPQALAPMYCSCRVTGRAIL